MSSYNPCPLWMSVRSKVLVSLSCELHEHRCTNFMPVSHRLPPTIAIVMFISYISKAERYFMLLHARFNNNYNDRQICLIEYLKDRIRSGRGFFKSKYIARELGLSSKEVGTNMAILAETCPDFTIERYSYSNSTTWLVTPVQA